MENKAGEINNLHPLMLLPDNLSSTSDSIYNEMTGKKVGELSGEELSQSSIMDTIAGGDKE